MATSGEGWPWETMGEDANAKGVRACGQGREKESMHEDGQRAVERVCGKRRGHGGGGGAEEWGARAAGCCSPRAHTLPSTLYSLLNCSLSPSLIS